MVKFPSCREAVLGHIALDSLRFPDPNCVARTIFSIFSAFPNCRQRLSLEMTQAVIFDYSCSMNAMAFAVIGERLLRPIQSGIPLRMQSRLKTSSPLRKRLMKLVKSPYVTVETPLP